jgi:ATP-dependent helicase YprA (DUF1998 family)/very-short-patch-repair endonuclease
MDIFDFRDNLVKDYANYVRSFIRIGDERIRHYVDSRLDTGSLWPDPLLQLNPSFASGGMIDDLVEKRELHPLCSKIFRVGKSNTDPTGRPMRLHRHQADALRVANQGHNYVVTTGTGSGKSLTYIVPIIDFIAKQGSGKGVKAVVVYPMNALANSQQGELSKFLDVGFPDGSPVTFRRYTGQETEAEKQEIIASPPDVLLTNYVMLELILTRPQERKLVEAAQGLKFLVFDELHTYRGRQGADVAALIRRVRERLGSPELQCIGTSATMSSEGTYGDKQAVVAKVASRIFGATVLPEHVVGETLVRATPEIDFTSLEHRDALARSVQNATSLVGQEASAFRSNPLTAWIETTFGVTAEADTGRLIRATPKRLAGEAGAAAALSALVGLPREACEQALKGALLAGCELEDPETGRVLFAFRLHQFISKGDAIYATLEDAQERYVTLEGQQYAPGRRGEALLVPLAFCRECGHEYYTVWRKSAQSDEAEMFLPRGFSDTKPEDQRLEPGFLYASDNRPWPDEGTQEEIERLPDDWLEADGDTTKLRSHRRKQRPETVQLSPDAQRTAGGKRFQFVAAPFRFCLSCGVAYPGRLGDFSKLNVFSSEGRATSTTILSLAAIRQLQEGDLPPEAQKLLSFTDNRQDAALQAGHFNDFVEVGLLRSALYRAALRAGDEGLAYDVVPQRVFELLALDFSDYAEDPTVILGAKRQTEEALREVLGYRLYQDLKRGWRLSAPNLEQVGLLEIEYQDLHELAAADEYWAGLHPGLSGANADTRYRVAKVLLDAMRRNLAINADFLDSDFHERLRQKSNQRLRGSWALSERERLEHASILLPRSRQPRDSREFVYLSERSKYGQFLRRDGTLPHLPERPSLAETGDIIRDLLRLLSRAGLVYEALTPKESGHVPGYQVYAAAMRWRAGTGVPQADPLTMVVTSEHERKTNAFFGLFYREMAQHLGNVRAAEHTAQVAADEREERERRFREGTLPVLYCSPTMELGVDIASLNVVNMRNVPPTPANYAQRSGRAGRSGQPALVFTYSANRNSHDQYFFKRQEQMVAGTVAAPRLELANEELLRAHIHAIWLAETGTYLGRSLSELLDLSEPGYPLIERIRSEISYAPAQVRARTRAESVLKTIEEDLREAPWYHSEWLDDVFRQIIRRFDATCDRWRDLYGAAIAQMDRQYAVMRDASAAPDKRKQAERLHREALVQRDLLIDSKSAMQSDFFSYRYFASEGFLPGYSFPRLPLSAFIPGRTNRSGYDEYVSRPRFLAISEFGPGAVVYHDGGKYKVNRVILPPARDGEDGTVESAAKRCTSCGYLHPVTDLQDFETCQRCGSRLPAPFFSLLRLQNVSTKRLERINADEEERQRLGYEIITAVRFSEDKGVQQHKTARVLASGSEIAELDYGHAATLWRINLGWRHRENKQDQGFAFDVERGYWATDKEMRERDSDLTDDDDPMSARVRKVIPFVEDRRNCLVWQPKVEMSTQDMASFQAALKSAIQVTYQLEDLELAAEPLPNEHDRRAILLYEAAEGGAGVLKRLMDDPSAVATVARQALEVCHFDPLSGDDLGMAPNAHERCEAACYNCLMSYRNQRDHLNLDRFAVREILLELTGAQVELSPTGSSRAEHLAQLQRLCESRLELAFLELLETRGANLPTAAQQSLPTHKGTTRPDFVIDRDGARYALYIDGPPHDYPDRQRRDHDLTLALEDAGYSVLRFHHANDWENILGEYEWLFGGAT